MPPVPSNTRSLAEDVEQELMELWSNVEKERAAHQKQIAIHVTRQARHGGTAAAATDAQAEAGLYVRTGVPYEAMPLKNSSADVAAGKERAHLHDKGGQAAHPTDPGAHVNKAFTVSQGLPVCNGSSREGRGEQSRVPGVEECCQENAHDPGDGCKHDEGGISHDVQPSEGSGNGKPLVSVALHTQILEFGSVPIFLG